MQQRSQWGIMYIDLVRLGTMVFLVTPTEMELLVWIGDCPWDHFILMKVWRRGTMSLAATNRVAIPASEAEDTGENGAIVPWFGIFLG